MTSLTADHRPTRIAWHTTPYADDSITLSITSGLTITTADAWTGYVRRNAYDTASLFTPTITVDSGVQTVTIGLAEADLAALMSTGQEKWNGYWRLQHSSGAEVSGPLVVERAGTRTSDSGAIEVIATGTTLEATFLTPVSSALLTRYPTPRGPETIAIGTSIERGTGGDGAIIGTFADGRPSNADWLLHACANSELVYQRQAGSGGDSLGGIGVLLADAAIGSTTLDIGFSYGGATIIDGVQLRGPKLPYRTQTVFFDYGFSDSASTGADVEACYVNAVPAAITGGVRCTLLDATTKAHSAGDIVRWGMIGRFEYDVARLDPCIVAIGGPTNDLDDSSVDGTGDRLTAAEIAEGQKILADMALAADAVPVVTTICARADLHTETDAANAAIRANAALYGYRLADFWRVLADPVTGDQLATYSADTAHPNQQGAELLGAEFVAAMGTTDLRGPAFRAAASDDLSSNMAPNGTFSAGTSGSGGTLVPVGWEVQEFFSSNTLNTVVAPELTDPVKGNLHRITSTAGKGTHGSKASISITESGNHAGFETGDLVYMRAWIRLRGFKADGFCKANIRLICTGASGASSIGLIWDWGRDFDGGWVTSQANTIPASVGVLSSLSLQIYLTGPPLAGADVGYGIFDVGEITLGNLTRGGL